MKISVKKLRVLLREALVHASPEYMKKEAVRQKLQELVTEMIASGQIQSDEELADFWSSVLLSVNTLRMVPLAALRPRR